MNEIAVSIAVFAIIGLIVWQYKSVFCLPFIWAVYFAFLYLGLLRIHAMYGGWSFVYAALAFGLYYLGLRAAEIPNWFRSGPRPKENDSGERYASADPKGQPPKTGRKSPPIRIKLLFPALPLKIGLFMSLLAATYVTVVFFAKVGIPVLSSFPALAWVESTSGIVNRLMTVFGPGCYAVLGLIAWAVYRETGSRAAQLLMYLGLLLAIIGSALLGSKAAAIMVFIWFNILLFYMNKKRELRKTLLPLIIIVVPASAAIVALRMMSSQGYWDAAGISETYYNRVTTEAAEPFDFMMKYMDRIGSMHGSAFHLEAKRVKDQLTGRHKVPILSEVIYNLMTDQPANETGLSAALTVYGTGYAEWGLAGLVLYAFIQGLAFGWTHRYLLRQETMNLFTLIFVGAFLNYLIATSVSGTILIGLETVVLDSIPPIVLLLPFSVFFILPLARRYRGFVGRRFSSAQQT